MTISRFPRYTTPLCIVSGCLIGSGGMSAANGHGVGWALVAFGLIGFAWAMWALSEDACHWRYERRRIKALRGSK